MLGRQNGWQKILLKEKTSSQEDRTGKQSRQWDWEQVLKNFASLRVTPFLTL